MDGLGDQPEASGDDLTPAHECGRQHDDVGGIPQQRRCHRAHRERHELQGRRDVARITDDPLRPDRIEEEVQARERALEQVTLLDQLLLLGGERVGQQIVVIHQRGAQAFEAPVDRHERGVEPCHVVFEEDAVVVRGAEAGQRPAEPRLHLIGRERHREHAYELRLEVVRLVDHEQAPAAELRTLPLAQREEVRGVRAKDRAVERRQLRAGVGALADRPARAATQALRRGDTRLHRIPLAEIVLAPLHELDRLAEFLLVLVLQELL